MSRNGSDGEFSGRVTEASVSEARSQDLVQNGHGLSASQDADSHQHDEFYSSCMVSIIQDIQKHGKMVSLTVFSINFH